MSFLAAIALASAVNVSAGEINGASPSFASLSAATAVELPVKAAALVAQADAKNLKQTTIDVVNAAVGLNPAAAPTVVGSIARSTPTMAATAVAAAVSVLPDQAVAIARAAAAAAPAKAGQIVAAVCRELPAKYKEVAEAVAEVVPGAGKEILTAIATAMPRLTDSINKILASNKGSIPSVATVLEQAKPSLEVAPTVTLPQATAASPMLAPPTVGPAYAPIPVSHVNIDPGSGGQVPTGGRNYAAP